MSHRTGMGGLSSTWLHRTGMEVIKGMSPHRCKNRRRSPQRCIWAFVATRMYKQGISGRRSPHTWLSKESLGEGRLDCKHLQFEHRNLGALRHRVKQELWAKVATYMVKQRIIGRGSPRLQTSIRTSQSRRSSPQDQARTMGEGRHINAYANVFFLTQMHVHPAMCSPGSTPRCSPHIAGSTTIAYGCSVLHWEKNAR